MRKFRTFVQLAPWVLGSTVLDVVLLWVTRRCVDNNLYDASNDVMGNFLQTLGGIYAVLLAFVLFMVWQQFNDARAGVEREASEIVDLFRTTKGLPEGLRHTLHARLVAYVDGVLEIEWTAFRCEKSAGEAAVAHVAELLDAAWFVLQEFEPESGCHGAIYSEALSCFNELSNARTTRLSASRLRMPTALRFLLYIGAGMLVMSSWMLGVRAFFIHAVVSGALAGAIAHIIYVIEDLDDCFAGDWQVPREAFLQARAFMVARMSVMPAEPR